jgi:hypothetical protein
MQRAVSRPSSTRPGAARTRRRRRRDARDSRAQAAGRAPRHIGVGAIAVFDQARADDDPAGVDAPRDVVAAFGPDAIWPCP